MPNPFGKQLAQEEPVETVEPEESENPFGKSKETANPFGRQATEEPVSQEATGGLGDLPLPKTSVGRKEQGRVSSAGGGFMRGFGHVISSLPKAVGEGAVILANKFGDDPIWGNPENITPEDTTSYQFGKSIDKWFNKFAVNPEYAEEFTAQLASGGGSVLGYLTGGFAAKVAKVPALAATMGLGATTIGVEGVQDYLGTLEKDEKADPKMREQAFQWNALLGTSEALPITRLLDRIDGITGGGVKRIIKEGFKGGVEELVQEVGQQVGQNAIASKLLEYDKDRDLFVGAQDAGEVGFTLGFMLNTLGAMVGARRMGKTGVPEEKPVVEPPGPDEEAPLDAVDLIGDEKAPDIKDAADVVQDGADTDPEEAAGTQDLTGAAPGVGASETAQEVVSDEKIEPQISYFDSRLSRDVYRGRLETMAEELVVGGGTTLIPDPDFLGGESDVRDEHGRPEAPLIRTPSLNPEWFQSLMEDDSYSMSVDKVQNAVEKAIKGDRLGVRQSRVVGAMLNNITGERTSGANMEYARDQLRIAREARAAAKMPDATDWLLEEEQYPEDSDGITRTLLEFQAQAQGIGEEFAGQVDGLLYSDMSDADIVSQVSKLFEAHYGQQSKTSGQALQGAEGTTEIPDTGAEPIAGEPAVSGEPEAGQFDDRLAGQRELQTEVELESLPLPAEQVAEVPRGTEEADTVTTKSVEIGKKPVAKEAVPEIDTVEKKSAEEIEKESIFRGQMQSVIGKKLADIDAKQEKKTDRRQKKKPGMKVDKRKEERRHGDKYRKSIDAMSMGERKELIEQLRHDATINSLTGVKNRAAWEEDMLPKAIENGDWIVSIDIDSLGWVNDNIGNEAGDMLLVESAKALKKELGNSLAHVSGDEFWASGSEKSELITKLKAAQEALKTAKIESEGSTISGLAFSYGITKDSTSADRAMKADKKAREAAGDRVAKTSRPDGVVLKGEEKDLAAAKQEPGKKTDLAGPVDEPAQAKKDAGVKAKKVQADKEQAAEEYAGEPDLLTGGELEPDLFAPAKKQLGKKITTAKHITEEADKAAASPENNKPKPTKEQIEAESYAKGHPVIQGLDIAIENPAGSKRKPQWPAMAAHYGDVVGYIGADGDAVDVFVKPDVDVSDNNPVFIINQYVKGKFDEHKTLMGFSSEAEARKAYSDSYTKDFDGLKSIHELTIGEFKKWLKTGDTKVEYGKVPRESIKKQVKEKPVTAKKKEKPSAPKPVKKTETAEPIDITADNYAILNGKKISYDVEIEDTGETVKYTEDSGDAMRMIDNRINNLKALLDCI